MKKYAQLFVAVFITFLTSYSCGWMQAKRVNEQRVDRIVAMEWGDGKFGPAFYGAQVYIEPLDKHATDGGYSVRARVHIGRGDSYVSYFHDCGELGTVQTDAEAVAEWGHIDWREDGLHIGNGPDSFFLEREKLENHR